MEAWGLTFLVWLHEGEARLSPIQLLQGKGWLRRQFPGHVHAPWELLGSPKLPTAAGRVSPGLHPTILEVAHRAAQHH
jgi:hypothetical protein